MNKTNVICVFPIYSGIFLNKDSKQRLLSKTGSTAPKYPIHNAHHITLRFDPGQTINVEWGAYVDLQVIRHVWDSKCQVVEVAPSELFYKKDGTQTSTTDHAEMINLLNTDATRFHITISKVKELDSKTTHQHVEQLLNTSTEDIVKNGGGVEDLSSANIVVRGFCGMCCSSRVENKRGTPVRK